MTGCPRAPLPRGPWSCRAMTTAPSTRLCLMHPFRVVRPPERPGTRFSIVIGLSTVFVEASFVLVEASTTLAEPSFVSVEASIAFVEASIVFVEDSIAFVEASIVFVQGSIVSVEASTIVVEDPTLPVQRMPWSGHGVVTMEWLGGREPASDHGHAEPWPCHPSLCLCASVVNTSPRDDPRRTPCRRRTRRGTRLYFSNRSR